MTQSGMTLRNNCPRMYILAAATGGSSGMLVDIGYTLRRRLAKMLFPKAPINAFIYCGALTIPPRRKRNSPTSPRP